jgi:hypothetical protein
MAASTGIMRGAASESPASSDSAPRPSAPLSVSPATTMEASITSVTGGTESVRAARCSLSSARRPLPLERFGRLFTAFLGDFSSVYACRGRL